MSLLRAARSASALTVLRIAGLGLASALAVAACGGGGGDVEIPADDGRATPDGATSADAGTHNDATSASDTAVTTDGGSDTSVQDAGNDGAANDGGSDDGSATEAGTDGATDDGGGSDGGADDGNTTDGNADDGATNDAGTDGSVDDGATPDASDASPCSAPDTSGTDRNLYVDNNAPPGGNGSVECPVQTILAATAIENSAPIGSTLTIHVKGASGGVLYAESGPVVLGLRAKLTSSYPGGGGIDPSTVIVRGQGACNGSAHCVIQAAGSTIEGITVNSPTGVANVDGIHTTLGAKIVDVTVDGTTGTGIVAVSGSITMGPGVHSINNADEGFSANTASLGNGPTIAVLAGGRNNHFDNNASHGFHVRDDIAQVSIESIVANNNTGVGIWIEPRSLSAHQIASANASNNTLAGVRMTLGPAMIAGSTFDANGFHGMHLGNGTDINASFSLTECQTNENGVDGVRIDTQHAAEITKLTSRNNGQSPPASLGGGSGLFIALGTSVTLRSSVLLGNTIGVFFTQQRNGGGAATTTLDLGTGVADLGENTFATTTKSANNAKGGVCIINSGVANSQKAVGDSWSSCPPTQDEIQGNNKDCYDATYADVVYIPQVGTSGAPVSTTPSCSLGAP